MFKFIVQIHKSLIGTLLVLFLVSCGSMPKDSGEQSGPRIRPATGETLTTSPAVVEQVLADLDRKQNSVRDQWQSKTFAEFKQSVYREPDAGKYIVNGDTPILDEKHLEEFFETKIKKTRPVVRLVVHQVGGQDAVWNTSQKKQLTYCVSNAFSNRYNQVVSIMTAAANAWEAVADVNYVHVTSQDNNCNASNSNVVFDVRPVNVNGQYFARAFFPNEPRTARNVLIDNSSFALDPNDALSLVGILRHELGHTLGLRHEHTRPESGVCFEDSNWRPLTDYDAFSVMHYPQCNGGGDWSLTLTNFDKHGLACLYGAAPGFNIDTTICPDAAQPPVTACTAKTQLFSGQVTQGNSKNMDGAFAVTPGSVFTVEMTGSGDPDLYVRFGQAPRRTSGEYDCRPYLNGADERCELDVLAGTQRAFVMVHGYRSGSYDLVVTHIPGQQNLADLAAVGAMCVSTDG